VNNQDLLTVAKGMGLNANSYTINNKGSAIGVVWLVDTETYFDPAENKAQAFEVLEWLRSKGEFIRINDYGVHFWSATRPCVKAKKDTLIKNLLLIALKVSEYEKELEQCITNKH